MPLDGSYGRLNAHNERFKELRRKKMKRREDKLKQGSLSPIVRGGKTEFKSVDPQKLKGIKSEIRKKGKASKRIDALLIFISIAITLGIIYFLYIKINT